MKLDGDELAVAMLPALTTKNGMSVFIRAETVESPPQNLATLATFKREKLLLWAIYQQERNELRVSHPTFAFCVGADQAVSF